MTVASVQGLQPDQAICPICDRTVRAKRMRKLYDVSVCYKCGNGFANRRQLAWVIDVFALWIATFIVAFLIGLLFEALLPPNGNILLAEQLFWILFVWLFTPVLFACKDGFSGYSPGKWLCGVRVVHWDTREPISYGKSFKRNLVVNIPFMPLIIALQMMKGRRSGDKWARTCVVWQKKAHRMPFDPRGILCTNCGYDLTGNVSGRCPECGKDIPLKAPVARLAVAQPVPLVALQRPPS